MSSGTKALSSLLIALEKSIAIQTEDGNTHKIVSVVDCVQDDAIIINVKPVSPSQGSIFNRPETPATVLSLEKPGYCSKCHGAGSIQAFEGNSVKILCGHTCMACHGTGIEPTAQGAEILRLVWKHLPAMLERLNK